MRDVFPYISARQDQLTELVADLNGDSLQPVATFFGQLARTVGQHAAMHRNAQERSREVARQMRELQGLGAVVSALVDQGRTLDEITRQLAAQGIPEATTLAYWRKHQRAMEKAAKWERDRRIMQLAAKGWTNAAIGRRVKLHPKSVSRIIRRQLRRAS